MVKPDTLYVVSSRACVRQLLLNEKPGRHVVWTSRDFFAYLRVLGFASFEQVLCDRQTSRLAATAAWFASNKAQCGDRASHEVNLLDALHESNLEAQHVCERLAGLSAAQQGDVLQQASLLSLLKRLSYAERLLSRAGLCDANTVWWRCLQHLQQSREPPVGLQKFDSIVFDRVVDLSALQWRLVSQLARLGLQIRVCLPDWRQLGLFGRVVEQIHRYLKEQSTTKNLHVQYVPFVNAKQNLLDLLSDAACLQSSDHVTQTGTCIQLQAAANPHQEAHWIAQRVVAWQRKHASPVRIAIAFSHITQQAYALQHVLHEYGVRCVLSRGLPLTQSPCMQFVVHVLRARQQGVPVHMVSALLAHPAYKMQIDAQKASQLQAMLAQTGVGHDTNMAQDSTGAFLRYLKQRSKHKDASLTMQIPFQETTACLEPLLKMLYAIPLQECLQNYLQHVVWLLQEHIVPSQDDCHAEVLALIKDLLRVWCTLSKHDEAASSHVLSLEDFVTWLHAHVQQHHISSKAVVDDALVEIVSTKQLWARQVDYVVLASLQHSNAAEHHRTKTLFNERHMSILRTVLGKEVLADPVAFDALWFAGAVLSAKKGLLVSAYLHDEQGKSVLPSTLFQRLCVACNKQFRQLGDVNIRFDRPLSDLQYQYESAQHALQQNHFQRVEKTASHEGIDTPVPCLSKKQWDQARLFACMQQQRQDFFAHAAPPASFAFAVGAHDLHGRFDKLGLRADGPLTPSRIEALAQCPFRFFVERLLQVHLPQQELRFSGLQTGQLAHRVLQRFYEQQAHTAESLQLEQIQNIVRQLVHECSKPWLEQAYEHEKPLWQGFCMWLQTAISQLIVRQVKHPPIHGVKPRHMELVVGSGEKCKFAPVPVNVNGKTIFLAGVLDRVDFGKQMCVVVDYKMSSQTQLSGKMAPSSLLRFHFQLPIYQRLMSHHFPQQSQGQLLGYLLSIRDGTPSTVLGGQRHPHWKERVQQDDRSDSLAAALKTVLQPIYDGNVPACVGPACQHCCLQHACRRPAG